tara:strand:+ start:116 stop:376 length:261 start_codon:yes stop_codon:yes gene_type:complete
MPSLYKIPFEIDPEIIPAFVMVEAIERHPDLIVEYPEHVDYVNITGTIETLAEFFHYLDGSAQSFPIDEFKEWAKQYEVDENGIPV